jgi:hypothetical protein
MSVGAFLARNSRHSNISIYDSNNRDTDTGNFCHKNDGNRGNIIRRPRARLACARYH